jgi:short-subunit dehydrogenase
MQVPTRPLAVVTGASSGIGLELMRLCAESGHDLVVAADRPLRETVRLAQELGVKIEALQLDLAQTANVETLYAALKGREVDVLIANAGHGLGRAFLDQDLREVQHVIDTNVGGMVYLVHRIGNDMKRTGRGRILITGSIAGFMPDTFQAIYNATNAFIDSFSWALRNELRDAGVTVTCLMPGPTDTEFFARADLKDAACMPDKMDAAEVARIGFEAMMDGEADAVAGLRDRLHAALAHLAS